MLNHSKTSGGAFDFNPSYYIL